MTFGEYVMADGANLREKDSGKLYIKNGEKSMSITFGKDMPIDIVATLGGSLFQCEVTSDDDGKAYYRITAVETGKMDENTFADFVSEVVSVVKAVQHD